MNPFRIIALLAALGTGAAQAAPVTIDFESFVDASNINGLDLGGVKVTNSLGKVEVYSNRWGVGAHSGTKAIASLSGSFSASVNPMVFTFASAVSWVQLFAGDAGGLGGDLDQWRLDLYDATTGGTLLASLTSPIFLGAPYQGLSYSGAGIRRVEAVWLNVGCCGIGFDDLSFDTAAVTPPPPPPVTSPVPLPAGGLLLAVALGSAGLFGRKRRA